jgi:hypothetical protein
VPVQELLDELYALELTNPRIHIDMPVQRHAITSIVFGASSDANIASTVELIRHFDEARATVG